MCTPSLAASLLDNNNKTKTVIYLNKTNSNKKNWIKPNNSYTNKKKNTKPNQNKNKLFSIVQVWIKKIFFNIISLCNINIKNKRTIEEESSLCCITDRTEQKKTPANQTNITTTATHHQPTNIIIITTIHNNKNRIYFFCNEIWFLFFQYQPTNQPTNQPSSHSVYSVFHDLRQTKKSLICILPKLPTYYKYI